MLIRTQNKKGIVNLDNIDTIDTRDKQVRYFSGGGVESMGLLGQYSTEEKAIKVLDMIQDAYARCESVRTLTAGTVFEIAREFPTEERVNEYKNIHRENFVFQMPADEDVEV